MRVSDTAGLQRSYLSFCEGGERDRQRTLAALAVVYPRWWLFASSVQKVWRRSGWGRGRGRSTSRRRSSRGMWRWECRSFVRQEEESRIFEVGNGSRRGETCCSRMGWCIVRCSNFWVFRSKDSYGWRQLRHSGWTSTAGNPAAWYRRRVRRHVGGQDGQIIA